MGRQFKPGQLQTGSLYNISSSFAVTASYALNAGGGTGTGFPFSGSAVITGSLLVSGSNITGDLIGTSSYATYAETASMAITSQNILVYVKNQSGTTINKGVVVRITGSNNSSDIPRIVTASYENDNNSANTLGVTYQSILNGSEGYVITEGVLTGINTTNFDSGQLIYLGASGSIIGYAPIAPLHAVRLGEVIRQQTNNGSIYVRIDNGYELSELHDVYINTGSVTSGDLLVRSGSVWINSNQLTGSYNITGSLIVSQNISTPSITFNSDVFIIKSGSIVPISISNTGQVTISGSGTNLFLIKNINNQPVLTVSQSGVVVFATQSNELTGPAPNGGIYFTSGAMFIGLT